MPNSHACPYRFRIGSLLLMSARRSAHRPWLFRPFRRRALFDIGGNADAIQNYIGAAAPKRAGDAEADARWSILVTAQFLRLSTIITPSSVGACRRKSRDGSFPTTRSVLEHVELRRQVFLFRPVSNHRSPDQEIPRIWATVKFGHLFISRLRLPRHALFSISDYNIPKGFSHSSGGWSSTSCGEKRATASPRQSLFPAECRQHEQSRRPHDNWPGKPSTSSTSPIASAGSVPNGRTGYGHGHHGNAMLVPFRSSY